MFVHHVSLTEKEIMMTRRLCFTFLTGLLFIAVAHGQTGGNEFENSGKLFNSGGFIRGGFYYDINNHQDTRPPFSSGFSDVCLKLEASKNNNFKAYSDIRFRYGAEFNNSVNAINIREAYAGFSFSAFKITAGQEIIKWGRTDFTNTISKLNPQNYILRSPDREDMDMGNILVSATWYHSGKFDFQAVYIPFYRPSILIIDPVPLPKGVEIEQLKSIVTDKKLSGYGLRANIHLNKIDFGITWFDGYDPSPGIKLKEFNMDMSGTIPLFSAKLKVTPYKIKVAGIDFESVISQFGLRGEVAYSAPYLDYKINEWVPLPEIKWAAGVEWNPGNWRFLVEYSGKYIPDFTPLGVEPLIGTEPRPDEIAKLIINPEFNIPEYFRLQTESFNRLYNYQDERACHSAGIKIERESGYGRIIPSSFVMYNFTSRDFLFIPEIRLKPFDGVTVTIGAEIYSGKKGSLYDIINDFMESIYAGLRIDF